MPCVMTHCLSSSMSFLISDIRAPRAQRIVYGHRSPQSATENNCLFSQPVVSKESSFRSTGITLFSFCPSVKASCRMITQCRAAVCRGLSTAGYLDVWRLRLSKMF